VTVHVLLELAWKSFLLAGMTLLLLRLLQRRSAAEQSLVANTGLVALMLLPVTVLLGPELQVQPPKLVAAVTASVNSSASLATPAAENIESVVGSISGPTLPVESLVRWTYAIPAGLLLTLLLAAILRLHLLRSRAEVLVEPRWATALSTAQHRMEFKHGTALLVSNELKSPISWGVIRPVILLDSGAATNPAQAEAIMAHELAHVARMDWAMLVLGRLTTAFYWFNPLVWVLARRSHELSEQAVDDAVLNSRVPSADYAALLINTACHDNRAVVLAANGVAGCGALSRRVERVLDASLNRRNARRSWIAACVAAMICVGGPVAAISGNVAPPSISQSGATGPAVLERALIDAVKAGDALIMSQLIAQGADVNVALAGEGSPLIAAAKQGRRDLAEALLAKGANINLGVDGDANPLIAAAAAGHARLVNYLLERGADIEAVVPSDENALMQASYHGHAEVVQLLVTRGADVNSRVAARTPLIMARMGGHRDIENLLRRAGAKT
jgi:beta-lactamase regulating signal transducer with metallopeptidase domain